MAVSTSTSGGGSAWTQADTIDEVLERMEAIRDALPPEDGVAPFNIHPARAAAWQVSQLE